MEGLITLNDLRTKFKSAGQYTVIVDKSKTPITPASQTIRLISGFSKVGNWNSLFYIEKGDFESAETLYGKIDKSLERKGSFFNRAIEMALQEGGVLALNLLKTVDEVDENGVPTANADVVEYKSLAVSPVDANSILKKKLYASFYNKERFWTPSPEYLLATRDINDSGQLLNFVNLGQRKVSIIVRKSDIKGYNIPFREWFANSEDIPSYVKPDDYVSDYFVDVIVLAGDYTNYGQLKNDVQFAEYFDAEGLIKSKFDSFLASGKVTILKYYSGSIIPKFKDKTGASQSVENMINRETAVTGILCAVDAKELDRFETETNEHDLDLVGHSFIADQTINTEFLSYKKDFESDVKIAVDADGAVITSSTIVTDSGFDSAIGIGKFTVVIGSDNADFETLKVAIKNGMSVDGKLTVAGGNANIGIVGVTKPVLFVQRLVVEDASITFELTNKYKQFETINSGSFVDMDIVNDELKLNLLYNNFFVNGLTYVAYKDSSIYALWKEGRLTDGSTIVTDQNVTKYCRFVAGEDAVTKMPLVNILVYNDPEYLVSATSIPSADTLDKDGHIVAGDFIVFHNGSSSISGKLVVEAVNQTTFIMSNASPITVNNLISATNVNGDKVLTRIKTIRRVLDPTKLEVVTELPFVSTEEINGDITVKWFNKLEENYTHYNLFTLGGFTIKTNHLPNDTNARVREIYSVMTEGNIAKSLVDPDFVDWRYLVDTFNHGLEPFSKSYLTKLVKRRQKALGLLNMPSAEQFKNSKDPIFTTTPTPANPLPTLEMVHIKTGGNLSTNPSFQFSLPAESDGASFAGYFFPNQIFIDANGDETSVPPALPVSNAFMRKWNNNTPFIAVAGSDAGALSDAGLARPEIPLDKEDRGELKELGVNPIFKKNGTTMIYGNSTAYQKFSSILNNVNARDTLISIEIDVENILSAYEFKSGVLTDETIKTLIETSLNNYFVSLRDSSKAIVSYSLTFDRTNNPAWVITSGASILDIGIELPEVTDRFISRISLNRQGAGVSVGSFNVV